MQSLLSADHESRQHSYRAEDEEITESTPLLQSLPQTLGSNRRDTITSITVGILLVILLSGIAIGTYLLIEQGKEENVLPPVEMALQFVSRSQWDDNDTTTHSLTMSPLRKNQVIIVQTDTEQCFTMDTCVVLLRRLQSNDDRKYSSYNFLMSSNGQTFEVLGWHRPSTLYSKISNSTLVLGFIGNFTHSEPVEAQVQAAKRFLDVSVSHEYLRPSFKIIGKTQKYTPTYLFQRLQTFPQWDRTLSDAK